MLLISALSQGLLSESGMKDVFVTRAAATKHHHRRGSNDTGLLSHSSGGWKASITVAAGPVWGEAAVLCFWTVASRCPGLSACECVAAEQALVSVSSHEDSGPVGPGLPLMTSNLDYFRTGAVPKYSGTGGGVRPSAYEVGLAGCGGRCSPHPT